MNKVITSKSIFEVVGVLASFGILISIAFSLALIACFLIIIII